MPQITSQTQPNQTTPLNVKAPFSSVGMISMQPSAQPSSPSQLASEAEVKAAILRELKKPGKSKF
jgi:hypothetical protein